MIVFSLFDEWMCCNPCNWKNGKGAGFSVVVLFLWQSTALEHVWLISVQSSIPYSCSILELSFDIRTVDT